MPTAARTRPWHARLLGPYATSDSDGNPGRVPKPSHDADRRAKPADPHALAGRWPRSRFAGNRARTLGARLYAASEALPVAPRAELASSNQVPVTHVARKAQMRIEPAPARIGRRAGGTKCPDRRREELLRAQRGCQATTESDMGAHRAPEVTRRRSRASPGGARAREGLETLPGFPFQRPAGGALRSPVAAVRSPSTGAALESRLCLPAS
jgi:hypothetical protein